MSREVVETPQVQEIQAQPKSIQANMETIFQGEENLSTPLNKEEVPPTS